MTGIITGNNFCSETITRITKALNKAGIKDKEQIKRIISKSWLNNFGDCGIIINGNRMALISMTWSQRKINAAILECLTLNY